MKHRPMTIASTTPQTAPLVPAHWWWRPYISREYHLFPAELQRIRKRSHNKTRISICEVWAAKHIDSGLDEEQLPPRAHKCRDCLRGMAELEAAALRKHKWLTEHPLGKASVAWRARNAELDELVAKKDG